MKSSKLSGTVVAVLLCVLRTNGIYIPGIDPVYYKMGQSIDVKGVHMTNPNMHLKNAYSWIPHSFTFLPLCLSSDSHVTYDKFENFGQLLRGDRKINIGYELEMGKNVSCRSVCSVIPNYQLTLSDINSKFIADRIRDQYFVRLEIDNLPGITKSGRENIDVDVGYPLGFEQLDVILINNYLRFKLRYHKHGEDEFSIVGFEIVTDSIDSNIVKFENDTCHWSGRARYQSVKEKYQNYLNFLYSVEWVEADGSYENRHDVNDANADTIRWHLEDFYYLFIISFIFSVIITAIVTKIRGREKLLNYDESMNETGWRSLHGDVFRTPKNPQLFAAIIGNGIQICCTLVTTLIFGTFGLISAKRPGDLVIFVTFSYAFFGLIAGYFLARLLGDEKSSKKSLAGAILASIDQCVFQTGLFFSLIFIVKQSNAPVPCTTLIAMLTCFIGLSTLCGYIGEYYGRRKKPFAHPVKTNEIPRPIVIQSCTWYTNSFLCPIVSGALLICVLSYILPTLFTSMYIKYEYSVFGICFIDFCIVATLCSQTTILVIYWQLGSEDYRWWWRSFFVSGSSAIYVLAYSVYYYCTQLMILDAVSILMYFGYTTLMIVAYWLLFGTIGFFASYVFVRQIYATVKINRITDNNSVESIITEKPPQISSEKEEQSSQE